MKHSNPVDNLTTLKPVASERQRLLVHRGMLIGGICALLSGLGWGLLYVVRQNWIIASLDGLLIIAGAVTILFTRAGRIRPAAIVLFATIFIVLCIQTATLDAPIPDVPRHIHHYFLVVGISSYLIFRNEPPLLRHGVTVSFLAAYFFFAATNWSLAGSHQMPLSIRVPGLYINTGIALLTLFFLLQAVQADLTGDAQIASDIHKGLAAHQFTVHFQPQAGPDGNIVGAECLLRWQHPQNSKVPIDKLMRIAEESGLAMPLGHLVLSTACKQLASWSSEAMTADLSLSVNVTALQFQQPDFVAQVQGVLERSGANPSRLRIELTENIIDHDLQDVTSKLFALKACGVRLTMDDFGTGFSSLSRINALPLDQLKIDRCFVHDLLSKPNDVAIVKSIISLSHTLGLELIAEGVESLEQRRFLAELGCHVYQGLLLSPPLSIDDLNRFIGDRLMPLTA